MNIPFSAETNALISAKLTLTFLNEQSTMNCKHFMKSRKYPKVNKCCSAIVILLIMDTLRHSINIMEKVFPNYNHNIKLQLSRQV